MTSGNSRIAAEHILWDVVEEHLDEAEFLFEQWESALDSPLYTLNELREGPEERLLAHIDGLVIGGDVVAERLLWPEVSMLADEHPRITAAALALLEGDCPDRGRKLISGLADVDDPQRLAAVSRAMAICKSNTSDAIVALLSATSRPDIVLHCLQALYTRRCDPLGVSASFLAHEDPRVRAAAMRLTSVAARAGHKVEGGILAVVEENMHGSNVEIRHAAIEVGLALGSRRALDRAEHLASDMKERFLGDYMLWLALFGEPRHVEFLIEAMMNEDVRARAVWALGFSGAPKAAEVSLQWLDDPRMGPLAGEAFAAIVGISYEDDEFWLDPPEDNEHGTLPTLSDDLELDLSLSSTSDLPIPNSDALVEWWSNNRSRFGEGTYLLGSPISSSQVDRALSELSMRRVHTTQFFAEVNFRGSSMVRPTRALGRISGF